MITVDLYFSAIKSQHGSWFNKILLQGVRESFAVFPKRICLKKKKTCRSANNHCCRSHHIAGFQVRLTGNRPGKERRMPRGRSHCLRLGPFCFPKVYCSFWWGWVFQRSSRKVPNREHCKLCLQSMRNWDSSRRPTVPCNRASSQPWEAHFPGWEDNSLAIAHSIFSLSADAANRSAN